MEKRVKNYPKSAPAFRPKSTLREGLSFIVRSDNIVVCANLRNPK
jgi:hypothetical protein